MLLIRADLQSGLNDERAAKMSEKSLTLRIRALKRHQSILATRRIPHDRGERKDQIAQRSIGVARELLLPSGRNSGAVPVDREHAAQSEIAGSRGRGDAEPRLLERCQ